MSSQALQDSTYQIILKALVKHFTVNEIKAMTAFYSSPEGKSIRQKMMPIWAEVMPQVNQELAKALRRRNPRRLQKPKRRRGPSDSRAQGRS